MSFSVFLSCRCLKLGAMSAFYSQLAGLTPGQSIMFSSETHMNRFWENFTNTCLLIYEATTLFIISSYSIRLCLGSID